MTIKSVEARRIYDSRGFPTLEVSLVTENGEFVAGVPSGASTGEFEALELRDGGSAHHGKGVDKAIANVNDIIAPKVVGLSETDQQAIDDLMVKTLDGTKNEYGFCKSKLGANAILGVSMAVCRAGAAAKKQILCEYIRELASPGDSSPFKIPVPCFNVINGGSHAGNELAMQEFMICPVGAKDFHEAMTMGSETYHHLKKLITKQYGKDATLIGDEGGFAPNVDHEDALNLLVDAIKVAGYEGKIKIAMDVAASEFHETGKYDFNKWKKDQSKTDSDTKAMIGIYETLITKYPIVSIEDPLYEGDFDGHAELTKHIGAQCQIVGDDLLVTNPTRIKTGIDKKSCNALLLKVNQIGSISESIQAFNDAKKAGWGCMVSHRSGETEDSFIADLVVGLGTGQIKTGAPCRSERLSKYNRIMKLEHVLGKKAAYVGPKDHLG